MEDALPQRIHSLPAAGGTYVLWLRVRQAQVCQIGRLGEYRSAAGYYAYVGSAQGPGGLAGRVGRHLRTEKRPHWHIDYLLPAAHIEEVWGIVSKRRLECEWACRLLGWPHARVAMPGFGASDCGCSTHLVYWEARPSQETLQSELGVGWVLDADGM